MSVFRTRKGRDENLPSSPSLLFLDLKRPRSEIKWLWSHQHHLLDQYHEMHLQTNNLALELPTGSGKTLVGLLIAEYRRRAKGERIAYLCPTKQLCHQVKSVADKEGVKASLLIGPQKEYSAVDFSNYQRGKAIAITTYSGLFNTNPRIDDPEIILCDDAHAADNYISKLWSVRVRRKGDDRYFYQALVEALGDAIPAVTRRKLDSPTPGRPDVDLVPLPKYFDRIQTISETIECYSAGTQHQFPWEMIRGHLEACCIYISANSILIRPYIPPTLQHLPFANAKQRVFMSATLGEGGDLERMTGISNIKRLPLPKGWEDRSTGRRLILFPNLLNGVGASGDALDHIVLERERSLVLVQDSRTSDSFTEDYGERHPELQLFFPSDIEETLVGFSNTPGPASLVLANRYDGIDLPGDSCRRLIIWGVPGGADLQEQFLQRRLGACSQYRDRIRTRITQGIGRCTRDENDFALVLLHGEDLLKWCSTKINIQGMNPELQAEIEFGLDNSSDISIHQFKQLCKSFFEKDDHWKDADDDIIYRRGGSPKKRDSVTDALESSVKREIQFAYALWRANYETAYDEACQATEALTGGKELRPYRGFWRYLVGSAAYLQHMQSPANKWPPLFKKAISEAQKCIKGVNWLSSLSIDGDVVAEQEQAPCSIPVIVELLEKWGTFGQRFPREVAEARRNINCTEKGQKQFEAGLLKLGKMLGCEAYNWEEQGSPDGLWILADNSGLVFEAKSDEKPQHDMSLESVRQALTHQTWIRNNKIVSEATPLTTVLLSYRTTISKEARICSEDTRYCNVTDVVSLFNRTAEVLTSVRNQARDIPEEEVREIIDSKYREAQISHSDVFRHLTQQRLVEL